MIPFLENKKVWGFPYLKIHNFGGFTTFIFHVFDRYEIHIQATANVFNGMFILSDPHPHKQIFQEIHTQIIFKNDFKTNQFFQNNEMVGIPFKNRKICSDSRI